MNTRFSILTRLLVATVMAIIAGVSLQAAPTTLQQADSAYNDRNFRQALTLYNKVLDEQGASSSLYYNIGNAHYRVGNVGQAIVAYERSLRLDPSNDDARVNLEFVNSTLKGLPEDGSTFLSNIHAGITSWTSPDGWAVTAGALFVLVLVCVAIYLFASGVAIRKVAFFGGVLLLIIFVYASVVAWQTAAAADDHGQAIVVTANAKLTTNPGTAKSRDDKTIAIPEGSKVTIIDSLATPNDPVSAMWYNVRLNNATEAWISATDVERI